MSVGIGATQATRVGGRSAATRERRAPGMESRRSRAARMSSTGLVAARAGASPRTANATPQLMVWIDLLRVCTASGSACGQPRSDASARWRARGRACLMNTQHAYSSHLSLSDTARPSSSSSQQREAEQTVPRVVPQLRDSQTPPRTMRTARGRQGPAAGPCPSRGRRAAAHERTGDRAVPEPDRDQSSSPSCHANDGDVTTARDGEPHPAGRGGDGVAAPAARHSADSR